MGGSQKRITRYFSRKVNLKERVTAERLRKDIEELPIIKHFFEGTFLAYLKTPASKKELERLMNDNELFDKHCEALRTPGATKLMAKYLQTEDGIESFIRVGKDESGLKLVVKLGQTPEGRKVARYMIASPLKGWPAMYRILKELGKHKKNTEDSDADLPSFDLSPYMQTRNPAEKILPLLEDDEKIGPVFISLSESDEASKLCKELLKDHRIRRILFDYLTCGKTDPAPAFNKLFKSKARRERITEIFMSPGGTKLLVDLAGNITGRTIMTNLAISGGGRSIGTEVLLKHPVIIIKVGITYFREPKN